MRGRRQPASFGMRKHRVRLAGIRLNDASQDAEGRHARPPSLHLEDWPSPVRHPSRKRWSARERRAGSNPASSATPLWSNGNDTGVRSRRRRFDSCRGYVSSEVLVAARPTVTREDQVRVLAGELDVVRNVAPAMGRTTSLSFPCQLPGEHHQGFQAEQDCGHAKSSEHTGHATHRDQPAEPGGSLERIFQPTTPVSRCGMAGLTSRSSSRRALCVI